MTRRSGAKLIRAIDGEIMTLSAGALPHLSQQAVVFFLSPIPLHWL